MDILWLLIGLALILIGANTLTDGASALAKRWGVSDLIIGLTVVAFGTSAPELSISIISAINKAAPMAIGNVVGSNIFNIFIIIGVVAVVKPIIIHKSIMTNEIPLVILSSIALLAIGSANILGMNGTPEIFRHDGILLLLFFAIFMRYTFSQAMTAQPLQHSQSTTPAKTLPLWKAVIYVAVGLTALIFGGDRFVDGASGIAKSLGMSDAIIGLTIVAAGTSLPELATSLTAALKGKSGIALGNVIGSNIFNIFLVLGITATISPLTFGGISVTDLLVMTAASVLFWFFGWKFGNRCINRWEGAILILCYIAYTLFQLSHISQ
ncbi:MAG: calcium/sodium antiporter [Prevotella sp.]|nr:calcium/sodium antiporter [Bacteroides sp.]MCM1366151.1 calcium/sodium antiporter [Prevotella sp.]MCM1436784.1 calcium/sodium antiporter [Prevotella sp.]